MPISNHKSAISVNPSTVLWCGAIVLCISLGVRHSFGLFLQPMSLANGWGRETFAFAIALQNLMWGVAQPVVGRLADKIGAAVAITAGGLLYSAGVLLMSVSGSGIALAGSAGVLIGLGLSGVSFPVVLGAIGRVMPPEKRSMAMGVAMAVGSFGQFAFLPGGLGLINAFGWEMTLVLFSILAATMLPLAWPLRHAHKVKLPTAANNAPVAAELDMPMMAMLKYALTNKPFAMLGLGYFVCGFQVVFINVHLPSYILDQGISATAGSTALALIGLFNIFGSFLAGKMGGKYRKPLLLTGIYGLRAVLIFAFVMLPMTEWSVYLFAAGMGVLWLSTVPLTTGTVGSMFGVNNLAMLGGLVFLFHQIGAFLGGWLGGLLFDQTGSYTLAWWICIALSVIAAAINWPIQEKSLVPTPTITEASKLA